MDDQNTTHNHEEKKTEETHHTKPVIENNLLMGILSYLGFLVLIPYLTKQKDPFVKFHLKQGLALFITEIIIIIISHVFYIWVLIRLLNLGTFILSVLGIINVVQKQEKELPIIGNYGKKINI